MKKAQDETPKRPYKATGYLPPLLRLPPSQHMHKMSITVDDSDERKRER